MRKQLKGQNTVQEDRLAAGIWLDRAESILELLVLICPIRFSFQVTVCVCGLQRETLFSLSQFRHLWHPIKSWSSSLRGSLQRGQTFPQVTGCVTQKVWSALLLHSFSLGWNTKLGLTHAPPRFLSQYKKRHLMTSPFLSACFSSNLTWECEYSVCVACLCFC